jgi:hypothetical protein
MMADGFDESSPGLFAFRKGLSFDLHAESIAGSWFALDQIEVDFHDAALRMGERRLGGAEFSAKEVLIIEMRGAEAFKPRDFSFEPGLLHEARIA